MAKKKETKPVVIDPKVIEVTIKLAEVGKVTFVIETKKDVSKLVKKAVNIGIQWLENKLDEQVAKRES